MSGVDGIGKHPKEKIVCDFDDYEFDLKIVNYNNKNLRLKIPNLFDTIDPKNSKLKVKSNSINIVLKKLNQKLWDNIKEKKSILPKSDEPLYSKFAND